MNIEDCDNPRVHGYATRIFFSPRDEVRITLVCDSGSTIELDLKWDGRRLVGYRDGVIAMVGVDAKEKR